MTKDQMDLVAWFDWIVLHTFLSEKKVGQNWHGNWMKFPLSNGKNSKLFGYSVMSSFFHDGLSFTRIPFMAWQLHFLAQCNVTLYACAFVCTSNGEDGFYNKELYLPQDLIAPSANGTMVFLGACDLPQPTVQLYLQYFQSPPYA